MEKVINSFRRISSSFLLFHLFRKNMKRPAGRLSYFCFSGSRVFCFGLLWTFLLFASVFSHSAAAATGNTIHESDHFRLVAPPPGVQNLPVYAEMCEDALRRLAPGFVLGPGEKKILVHASPDPKDFEKVSRMRAESTMAVAFPNEGTMVLNIQALAGAEPTERFRVVGHEMVHLLLGRLAGRETAVPAWLHEGLAQRLTGQRNFEGSMQLAWAGVTGHRIPMTRLVSTFPYGGGKSDLAYAESASFAEFVATKGLNFNNSSHFFQQLLKDPERARMIFARLGDYDILNGLEQRWVNESQGWTRNWLVIITSNAILWGVIALLFLATYWIKRYRRERVMADWDPWEREDDGDEGASENKLDNYKEHGEDSDDDED